MITPAAMRELVRRHIQLWKSGSHAEWRACFSADYQIEDPVGTGSRPMGSYEEEWDNMHSASLRLDMEAYRLTVGGREIVADLRAVTHLPDTASVPSRPDGRRHTLSYTGIYTVDDDGLLCANRTFADPVSDELWKAFYPSLAPPGEREPAPRSAAELRQSIEDHLYFWNVGSFEQWRRRFSEGARIEDPAGSAARSVAEMGEPWSRSHGDTSRVRLGCHRVIVCGMEALAHTVAVLERSGAAPRTAAHTEIFAFDAEGSITSWRVFRE